MNGVAAWHWVSCLSKKPSWRSGEDVDIICAKLKTMKVFENYPENILMELSRYILYDTFLANVTLFRPGEEGLYWYAIISGSLEMLDVDSNDPSKNTIICQLGSGDSFGENVIFGTHRQTTIVTKDYCELLYMEAANIRMIYEAHKEVMEGLLRLSSLAQEPETETDGDNSLCPDSDLTMAGLTLLLLIKDHFADLIGNHKVNMFTYQKCCSGRKLVDWVIAQSSNPRTRQQVVQMWQSLLTEGVLQHVNKEHPFRDDPQLFYQFVDRSPPGGKQERRWSSILSRNQAVVDDLKLPNGRPRSNSSMTSSPRSSRSSLSSILDECFDTIAALGPETLIYAALNKDPSERTEEDIELIYEELLHIRALRHLSNAVKRQIAVCTRLEHYKRPGKYLFRQGDTGNSWYIILRGSVNVIIQGKGVVCTLHEGDEFGKLALVHEATRSSSIQVREDNSYFLRIERTDFQRILLSVESTTIKFTEKGKEVLVLEKALWGRYLVVKGTPERMLDHLLDSEIEKGSQEASFAQDFFLTYPAFVTISELCDGLKQRYHGKVQRNSGGETPASVNGSEEESTDNEDQELVRKRRVAGAMCIWILTAKAELVKDKVFLELLKEIQDCLAKDGLTEQLKALTTCLAESIKSSTTNLSASGSDLMPLKSSRKGSSVTEHEIKMGISTVPPHQPQDKVPLRIHTLEHTCCRLQLRLDSTAKTIVSEACQKLNFKKPSEYVLCEVRSSGEKVQVKDSDISVHSTMSVNGRLYIVPKNHPERVLPPLPDQNQKPATPFPDKDGSKELAAHLTIYDWNLFSNIQQMEYIYQLFGRHKFGKITTNLDMLIRRFNEVEHWTVTEICREQDLAKRVNLVKKFIKMAGYCKGFNNLNSFFAITIGLMHGSVSRLRQTWKEIPPRLRTRFEQFQALTDPSRNHKVLRAYQSKLLPPVIPFMPLVSKDAYFLNVANETFVDKLVNFEKMRLVASSVRALTTYRTASISAEAKMLANKNPSLQQYFRNLRVIDNELVLTQMSHAIEPLVSTQTPRPLSNAS